MAGWVEGIIHFLALHYHWAKSEILDNVYLDEALFYLDEIRKAQLEGYLMQLAIASNPHTKKPKELYDKIRAELYRLEHDGVSEEDFLPEKGAFNKLKRLLNRKKTV